MEINEDFFSESTKAIQDYLEDRWLLVKLKITDKVVKVGGIIIVGFLVMTLVIVFLLMLGVLGAYFFASLTGSMISGLAIITGIYLVAILIVLFILKKWIQTTIVNKLIKQIFAPNKVKTKIINHV